MTENFPGPMAGKTALVTGGTGGIGRATAAGLAALGARVGITGRDKARTQAAATGIVRESGNPAVDAFAADMSCQAGVRALAGRPNAAGLDPGNSGGLALIIHAGCWLPRSVSRIAATAEILASGYDCGPAGGPVPGFPQAPRGSTHGSQGQVRAGQLVSGSAQIRCQARVIASAQGQFAAIFQRRRRPPRTRRAAAFRTR